MISYFGHSLRALRERKVRKLKKIITTVVFNNYVMFKALGFFFQERTPVR